MKASRDIFRAIHERKWVSVEYRNRQDETTRYWMGVNDVDPRRRRLSVRGMHLGTYELADLNISFDSILQTSVVDGSYYPTPSSLIQDIAENEERYASIFGVVPNLKVLDYLADCIKLNTAPYTKRYSLVERVDEDSFKYGAVPLDDAQFRRVVETAQRKARDEGDPSVRAPRSFHQIGLNVLSVHTNAGLYVLAYRQLRLDAEKRQLVIGRNTVLCREFKVKTGRVVEQQSIRRFLEDAELHLLEHFDENRELVKDLISARLAGGELVDDEPHVLTIARDISLDPTAEYDEISAMCEEGSPTVPIQAFFGNLTKRPRRRKEYPLVLLDQRINLDQLLAVHQALKYPLTYVQGPPGTGKTTTIVNLLVNAFFNDKTMLFASYNNHPVDGVFKALRSFRYENERLPLPVLRLGDRRRVLEALNDMRELYQRVRDVPVMHSELQMTQAQEQQRARQLAQLLREHEENLDLKERRECIEKLAEENDDFAFGMDLQGRQLGAIEERLRHAPSEDQTLARAIQLTCTDAQEILQHLYYQSVRCIQRLGESRNGQLRDIVMSSAPDDERIDSFNGYISQTRNLKALLRIFPIVATTCISAHRLGQPDRSFDLCVIDEASQCDTASALVPIVRARSLVLVGDPQQLSPVVVIDKADNAALRRTYRITDEYDFVENSAYKAFLACDAVSNEILLRDHYRCDEAIIGFNNRKYYNGKLEVKSGRRSRRALRYVGLEVDPSPTKNVAPSEADAVVAYVEDNPDKAIGIVTPFANQREYLMSALKLHGHGDVPCGTVHAFQGDEREVILFSLALTDRTTPATYGWLCNNRELINVATSRARDELVIISCDRELERLHRSVAGPDDLYELVQYVKTEGESSVTPRAAASRALGIKPFSTKTEAAFLENLNHALGNIFTSGLRHDVEHEVPIASVFNENLANEYLFYSGRFDFVVYELQPNESKVPVLAIELDGMEHRSDEAVEARDRQKNEICARHGMQLIRVENSYARRYHHIKEILVDFFAVQI